MRSRLASVASIFALVLAFFVPSQPALSDTMVTKTVTVTDSSGQPYVQARVAMLTATDNGVIVRENNLVLTDGSGTAQLSVPADPLDGFHMVITVQPGEGDVSHAIGTITDVQDGVNDDQNETFTIQLEPADTLVTVKDATGNPTPAGTTMFIVDKNNVDVWFASTLSSGTAGLALETLDPLDGPFELFVQTSALRNSWRSVYDIDLSGANPVLKQSGVEVSKTSGVYQLQLREKNIQFRVVNQATNELLDGVSVRLLDENYNYLGEAATIAGLAGAFVETAGDYKVELGRNWEDTTSELVSTRFDLNASGSFPNFSYTLAPEGSNSTISADGQGVFELEMPLANVSVTVNLPNGDPFVPSMENQSYLDGELQVKLNGQWEQYAWTDWVDNKVFTRVTEAGTYRFRINALNDPTVAQAISNEFTVSLPIPATGSVHSSTASLSTPNFVFRATFNGTAVESTNVRIEPQSQYDHLNWIRTSDSSGVGAYRFTEAGTYRITLGTPWSVSGASETTYIATVNFVNGNAVVSIPGISAVNGVFDLPYQTANLVIRPVDENDELVDGSYINVREVTSNGERHITGQGVQNGLISLGLPQGNYVFDLDPGHQEYLLAPNKFKLVVAQDTSDIFIANLATPTQEILPNQGAYTLELLPSNVIGRVVQMDGGTATPLGDSQNAWVDVELQKLVNGNWEWADLGRRVNENAMFGFHVSEPGTYRLKINPMGYDGVSATTLELPALVLTSSDLQNITDLSDVAVSNPSLTVSVSYDGELVRHAGLEIRQGDDFIEWGSTGPTGQAGLAVSEPGSYQLVVHPPYELRSEASRKTYDFEVDQNMVGTVTGITAVNGVFPLTLASPSLRGQVLDPEGNDGVGDAQVLAVDQATNETLWHLNANTDEFGFWSMSLPEGSYKLYARAPWGTIEFGDGPRSGVVTVDSNGNVAVPSGQDANAFDLRLSAPTFSGIVVEPGTSTRMTNVQVCLIPSQSDNNWYCSHTNSFGEWALSAPDGFTDFDDYSELVIGEWGQKRFAERRVSGSELETLLTGGSYTAGQTYPDILLAPASPNLLITVNAGANKAGRVWVSVDRPNVGWIGGSETDSNGVARIFVPNNLHDPINVQVSVENNPSLAASYASTRVELSASGESGATRSLSIDLDEPNLRGKVLTPGGSALPVRNAWIEIFNEQTGDWFGGAGTNAAGEFSIALPVPQSGTATYRLAVNPPWNFTGNFAKKVYYATIADNEAVTITDSANNAVAPANGLYSLPLATPSVVGVVKDSNGNLVRDSWVAPLDNSIPAFPEYKWEYGSHSKEAGNFSMALPDGAYLLEANPAWNSSGNSKSARCAVVVSGGSMNQSTPCYDGDNSRVELTLRAPNVKFKLVDPDGNGVAFANVGVGFGSWHTWTQSDRNGNVALYIDAEEIDTLHPQIQDGTLITPHMWFDPPYGNGDLVRWECEIGENKPVCGDLDAISVGESNEQYIPAPGLDLGDVAFPEPNTKIRVANPAQNGFVPNAWVGLMIDLGDGTCTGNRQWIGGANTDANGWAAFNVENLSAKYCIEVNAPWNQREAFAPKTYAAANQAAMNNQVFALAAPNLKVKLLQAVDSRAAKWSWIGVEEVTFDAPNSRYDFSKWITGVGTDNQGNVSLALPEPVSGSTLYRITGHPGSSIVGARVSCIVSVDSAGDVSQVAGECADGSAIVEGAMTLTLSAGNVSGAVEYNGSPIAGAIVAAVNAAGEKVTTVTNAQGQYKLQLTEGVLWTIKVFTVSRPGDLVEYNPYLSGTTVTPSGPSNPVSAINLTLAT